MGTGRLNRMDATFKEVGYSALQNFLSFMVCFRAFFKYTVFLGDKHEDLCFLVNIYIRFHFLFKNVCFGRVICI